MRRLFRFLKGYVKVQIRGYSPERFLNMCSYRGIAVWGLTPVPDGYFLYMSVSDFRKIRTPALKTHTRISVKEKYGAPFFLNRCRYRKPFIAGVLFCVILVRSYSLFIWDIHFEGNEKWTDETLAEFLKEQGTAPGMLRSRVDCQAIVKAVRKEYNDIVWVSASIDGSRLKVEVKENEDTFQLTGEKEEASGTNTDLIAAEDGVITQIVTRTGVPQVHVGDRVEKGDLLVLGRIEILNDSQEVVGYQYQSADADVFADTAYEYTDSVPVRYEKKIYNGKKRGSVFLCLNDWKISLGTAGSRDQNSETSVVTRQLKAGENFYLPVFYGYQKALSYDLVEETRTNEEIREILTLNFSRFCEDLEEKGIQIRENSVKIQLNENSACASGTVFVNQSIAEEAETEIITVEREEKDESGGTDD